MGRPTKLNAATQEAIVTGITLGATYELAANAGGISYDSFNNWMKRGETELRRRENPVIKEGTKQWLEEDPYVQFFEAIKMAEAQAVINWLAEIEAAATTGSWQAAAWKLERRYPSLYGRKVTELAGNVGVDFGTLLDKVKKAKSRDGNA